MTYPKSVAISAEVLGCAANPISVLNALRVITARGGPVDFEHVVCLDPTFIEYGDNLIIQPFTVLSGRIVIGSNVKIGPQCFLRGPLFIGDNVMIGTGVEISRSILLNDCKVPHQNIVLDSIVGERTHIAGGVFTANVRIDNKGILCESEQTNRLGAIIGNDVKIGVGVQLLPGCVVHDGQTILGPCVVTQTSVRKFKLR